MNNTDPYESLKSELSEALTSAHYYQTIFIEYGLLESYTEAILHNAGIKTTEMRKNGPQPLSLGKKLNILHDNATFTDPAIRSVVTLYFLTDLDTWKHDRDELTHNLVKVSSDEDRVKDVALRGRILVLELEAKMKAVNNCFERKRT